MRLVSATTRVTFGLVCLAVSVWMTAFTLGLFPDADAEKVEGRAALCENVALHCSLFAAQNNRPAIEASLEGLVMRNQDIDSAGLRRPDGSMLASVGKHELKWKLPPGEPSTPYQMRVPVFAGDTEWGTVEVCFAEAQSAGALGWILQPMFVLGAFVAAGTYLIYFLYLRKMLKHLDPSKVIPKRVRQTLDTLAEGLLVLDNKDHILLANEAFAQTLGLTPEQLTGRKADDLGWEIGDLRLKIEGFPWQRAAQEDAPQEGDLLSIRGVDGRLRTFKVSAMPVCGEDGVRRGTMASFDDVTEIESNREQMRQMLDSLSQSRDEIHKHNIELERLAAHDPLTDCLNRRAFFSHLENHWGIAKRHGHPLSCIMIDLDHFKSINDNHGHQTGDAVLVETAKLLRKDRRQGDLVGRYGGEEFCVFLPHTDIDDAAMVAEQIRQTLSAEEIEGLTVTASIGVSSLSLGAPDPQSMIDQADKCLYVAKRNGRNCVIRFDEAAEEIADFEASAGSQDEAEASYEEFIDEPTIPFHAVTALVSALSYRDPATADHSRRVADLCVATARRLMPTTESYILEIAALLHDIGKIGVPDSVLLKPGKLTDDEWRTMQSHRRIGAEIVQSTFSSPTLSEVIRTYRAWFGGNEDSTLPTGKSIPLAARILAIADAYDSMTSRTAYREPASRDEAFAELRRCAGDQFDDELVERFIGTIEGRDPEEANSKVDASKAAALSIGAQIERLSEAIDNQDRAGVSILARRLSMAANQYEATDIANVAEAIQAAADNESDITELMQLTTELVDLCRMVQRSYLRDAVAPVKNTETEVFMHA